MSSKNRGDRIQLLQKVVSKHFTPVLAPKDRNILEHLIYASVLEDAPYDAADEAFHRLQECFVDWNEVRVTTVTELVEHLQNLPDAVPAATRVKKNLQSIFETRYSFDLEELAKMNQGKAIAELEKFGGMSNFVLNYVTQNAFGGHAIPVSGNIVKILLATEIMSDSEAVKGQIPSLERTVPKSKGAEFASCLHQFGLLVVGAPGGKNTKAILKEAGAPEKKEKAKEEKTKEEKPKEAPVVKAPAKAPEKPAAKPAKDSGKAEAKSDSKAEAKKPAAAPPKKPAAPVKKAAPPAKKATEKPVAKKPAPPKKPGTKGGTPPTKRKPK
ncbi:MAG: hypothetical protein U0930_13080 [Pirellulales bacterium]